METIAVFDILPINEEFLPAAVKVAARKEIQDLAQRKRRLKEKEKGRRKERREEGVHQRIASFLRIMRLLKLEEERHPQERRMPFLATHGCLGIANVETNASTSTSLIARISLPTLASKVRIANSFTQSAILLQMLQNLRRKPRVLYAD